MKKVIAILGPTATGKTDLGIGLAKKFDGEIVSADSRQVYEGMDIGTGKADPASKTPPVRKKGSWVVDGVPVHLYDILTPDQSFSVASYQQKAYEVIEEIHKRGKLPILVGGTGLYIRAVVEGLNIPKVAPDADLRKKLEKKSLEVLQTELEKIDPVSYQEIDKQNPRRLIRALEVFYQTGKKFSELRGNFSANFDTLKIGLTAPREVLYKKADQRVDIWFENGFVEEVKKLLDTGFSPDLPPMSSLGYRQVAMHLEGKLTLQEAKQRTKWEQHGYIRRQTVWFKKESGVNWFDTQEDFFEEAGDLVKNWLDRKQEVSVK